ncbi:oligosaccharide flippase family protein [Pseudarthrobacter sp. AL07]|uniref:lipopolysaccharide biosynthesis protein n=1 Tax=unclassified Pseudarthrobacter TaxID=2647000 RepID=UPI00249A0EDF|nr:MULTISPECIES: oligosaccharide flippase family protein [unclassified Pseudarthrobacter]MDI3196001.1 oligosaccharide flippase family protein [Pseudarthrobacter sp. AL20]MDI3210058.1 oligosaccharide flippase family protein [Pseudarthrobacter sp. AL07]
MRAFRSSSGKEVLGTTIWGVIGLFGALLCGVITARLLLPDDRGALAIVITTVTIVSLVSGLGTNISLRVLLPRDARITLRGYAKTSICLAGIQLVALSCAAYFLLEVINIDMGLGEIVLGILPLGIAAFFANQSSDALSATGHPSRASMANSIGFGVTAVFLILSWLLHFGLLFAVLAYTAGFITRAVVGMILIDSKHFAEPDDLEPGGTKALVRKGIGLMGMNLGQSIAYRLDQYLLATLADTREVGFYAVATTPASLIQVVSNSIGQVAFRDTAQNQMTRRKLVLFTVGATGVTGIYAGWVYFAAPWLVPFVFGEEYASAIDIVRILALAEIALSPYLVLSRAVAGAGHIRLSSWTGIVGMGAMAFFLVLMIPGNEGSGAAWACVAGYSTMSLFLLSGMQLIRWRTNVRLNDRKMLPRSVLN